MARKSILFIITKSVWGGAAKYVYDLATNLPEKEFKISVSAAPASSQSSNQANPEGKFVQKIKEAQIPYFPINNFQRTINPLKDICAFFEILFLLFQLKPQIIHVNSSKAGGIVGLASLIYQIFHKTNLIFTAHGWAFAENRPKWQIFLIKLFSKITCLFYNKIICVSEYDRQIAIKNKIASVNKLTTIYNGIDIDNLSFLNKQEARNKLIQKDSSLVIGSIAEWNKNKGIKYLLEAVKKIQEKKYQFDLVLIGSGENPDKKEIKKYIEENQINNIHLIEYLPQAAQYLKAFDIFVLPSLKEGLPYTIIEAMFAEVPIIASQVGGLTELLKPDCGILILPKNPDLIEEKIFYLINNTREVQEITKKARQKVKEKFNLERMIKQVQQIY